MKALHVAALLLLAPLQAGDKPAVGLLESTIRSAVCPRHHVYVPEGYDGTAPYSIVLFAPPMRTPGVDFIRQDAWKAWAARHRAILLAPTFEGQGYVDPASGSGKAVMDMVAELRKEYKVDADRFFLIGYSGGAQLVHRLAWRHPKEVRAVAAHAAGSWSPPEPGAKGVPFVLTVGDKDERLEGTSAFHAQLAKGGYECSLKVFPGMTHFRWDAEAVQYSLDALGIYIRLARLDPKARKPFRLLGDRSTGLFYLPDQPEAAKIPAKSRVAFSCPELAELWGKPAEGCVIPDAARLPSDIMPSP